MKIYASDAVCDEYGSDIWMIKHFCKYECDDMGDRYYYNDTENIQDIECFNFVDDVDYI